MMTSAAVILNFQNVSLSDEQFYQLCQDNETWQLERTASCELVIMPPDRIPVTLGEVRSWSVPKQGIVL